MKFRDQLTKAQRRYLALCVLCNQYYDFDRASDIYSRLDDLTDRIWEDELDKEDREHIGNIVKARRDRLNTTGS